MGRRDNMKIHESAENYLETILLLEKNNGHVRSIDIATELGFSKPSVSVAMKNLRENGYIETDSAGHIVLLSKGREVAEKMMERHMLLTKWLISIGVPEDIASDDACKVEHVISEETFAAIKNLIK